MVNFYQLEQLLAIARCGTLSKAAEELNLSQPALTRSMQKLEEQLQVKLFDRQKNKINLNSRGEIAVLYAQKIMNHLNKMIDAVHSFDRMGKTFSVGTCAPAPLWDILPKLSSIYPEMSVSSEIDDIEHLTNGLQSGLYQMIVLPMPLSDSEYTNIKYHTENLYFSLPKTHFLADSKGLYFKDLDGETFVLYSQIGIWNNVCEKMMPSSKILIKKKQSEALNTSSMPSFTSNIALERYGNPTGRAIVPILDEEASITYHCVCMAEDEAQIAEFIKDLKFLY